MTQIFTESEPRPFERHCVPINDLREHIESRKCWCEPIEVEADVWLHNSADRREYYERGWRKPS